MWPFFCVEMSVKVGVEGMTRKKEGISSITEIGYNHYRARSAGAPTASISPPDEDLNQCVPYMPVTVTTTRVYVILCVRLLLGHPPIHRFEKGGPPSDEILRKNQTNTFTLSVCTDQIGSYFSVKMRIHSYSPPSHTRHLFAQHISNESSFYLPFCLPF